MKNVIEFTNENNTLNIKLSSRLDKTNSKDALKAILDNISDNISTVKVYADELKVIDADGLDVFIEIKKKVKDLEINNAGIGICDVFSAYGFSNVFAKINKSYRFLSIEGCEQIGHGGHGAMYKVGEDTIVKVYIDKSALEVIENERKFARNAFINGIPTAIAYDVVETEKGYGVVFEMLGGMTLGKFLSQNPDKLEEYGNKFADLLFKLNNTDADPTLFKGIQDVFLERISNAISYGFLKDSEGEKLKEIILSIPLGNGMIHGDYHPNNVMIDENGELMLIDMADLSRGNGFFDIGGTYLCMKYTADTFYTRKKAQEINGINYKDCIKLWKILLKRYYHTDDEKELEKYNDRCHGFSDIRIAASLGMKSSRSKIFTNLMILYTRYIILPKADKYIKLFSES